MIHPRRLLTTVFATGLTLLPLKMDQHTLHKAVEQYRAPGTINTLQTMEADAEPRFQTWAAQYH